MKDNLTLNKKIALTGALSALVIVLGITHLGIIPLNGVASITILQIPVILAVMLAGLPSGLFVGFVFGLMSLIQAAMNPTGVLDPLFVKPWISVLPRMLLAVVAWAVWKVLNIIPKMPKSVSAGITAFISTLAHTVLVIGSLYLLTNAAVKDAMGGAGFIVVIAGLTTQAIIEAIAATVICTAVYLGLFIASNKKSKLSKE